MKSDCPINEYHHEHAVCPVCGKFCSIQRRIYETFYRLFYFMKHENDYEAVLAYFIMERSVWVKDKIAGFPNKSFFASYSFFPENDRDYYDKEHEMITKDYFGFKNKIKRFLKR